MFDCNKLFPLGKNKPRADPHSVASIATAQELILTQRSTESNAPVVLPPLVIDPELTRRIEDAGFCRLAAAVRSTAESTMIGLPTQLPAPSADETVPPKPTPRLHRKSSHES